jgi:hypothetical protein
MHTILISRGSLETRLLTKKMLEGELFLEELHNDLTDTNKVTGVKLWACPADGKPPFNILEETNVALEKHEKSFNTSRKAQGLWDTQDYLDHDFDYQQEHSGEKWDPKLHPHGATSIPTKDRLAAYDGSARLRSEDPINNYKPTENLTEMDTVVTLRGAINDYVALKSYADVLVQEVNDRIDNLISGGLIPRRSAAVKKEVKDDMMK